MFVMKLKFSKNEICRKYLIFLMIFSRDFEIGFMVMGKLLAMTDYAYFGIYWSYDVISTI